MYSVPSPFPAAILSRAPKIFRALDKMATGSGLFCFALLYGFMLRIYAVEVLDTYEQRQPAFGELPLLWRHVRNEIRTMTFL